MPKSTKSKASTQDHLDIEDITDDLVILKTGWVALALTATSVNFDLLSETEQDTSIYAYGALLNSLSFPIQILIRSKKADITSYFHKLTEASQSQPNPDLKRQIQKYQDFIQTIVQQKTVLDKRFYIIINFSPLELGFKGLTGTKPAKNKSKSQLINDAKIALTPKRDHLIKQLARIGLTARQLNTQELLELFYDIYNPAPTGTQRVLLDSYSYTTPIVQPAIEVPSTPSPSPKEPTGPPPYPQPITPNVTADQTQSIQSLRPVPPNPQVDTGQTLQELQDVAAKAAQLLGQPIDQTNPKS